MPFGTSLDYPVKTLTMRNTLLAATLLMILVSCAKEKSENVNQDSIYTIYELFYNADTDKTIARAIFRFGGPTGTLLELNAPASSTFNGDALSWAPVSGFHKKEYAGFTSSGTFVYTDLDANTFTNSTATIDTIAFPAVDTISAGSAFTFTWTGNPLIAGETVTLTINGPTAGNVEIFSVSTVGATEIVLSKDRLDNLGIGDGTMSLTRVFNRATVDEGTSTGGRMAVWYTVGKSVYIDN